MVIYFSVLLLISVVFSICYAISWHKNFDVHLTLIFTIIPIANVGYFLYSLADDTRSYLSALQVIYLGGCFLILFIMLNIFSTCGINVPKWIKALFFIFNTAIYMSVLTAGKLKIFYKDISIEDGELVKEYGGMHTVFIIMVISYTVICAFTLLFTLVKKDNISHRIILLLFCPTILTVAAYFMGKLFGIGDIYLVPVSYVISQFVYLGIVRTLALYNLGETALDSIVKAGSAGFISIDNSFNFLGGNDMGMEAFPELKGLHVDSSLEKIHALNDLFRSWIHAFLDVDVRKNTRHHESGGKVYLIEINYLFDGRRNRGYQFFITDDTKDQKYIALLDKFNDKLMQRVDEKTRGLREMHDRLIMSMATMVESRDNSTGGHIKRTSVGVKLLTDEMVRDEACDLDETFVRNIIKAAPMHDLGKIAVPDSILQFNGRYEPWQFEQMKRHAPEGARIVHEILEGTDDEEFHHIAENVAHYHHERWDGSGYPDGLKGEEIPLEARIMAIADVYDALVSKRCYKDSLSFEKADSIIMEGMGTQFDKSLEKYYVAARPKLEEYYKSLPEETSVPKEDFCDRFPTL